MALRQAVLCGYYGYGNGGDEALLAALLQMLPPQISPLVLSGNPRQTYRDHGVKSCDRYAPAAVWQALRSSELFIWGGGSLIQDATSAISPFYYLGLMGLAQGLGLKTVAWGQGIGPLRRPLARWTARQAFQGCDAISVRDRASAALLAAWKLPCVLAPDPVWALEPLPVEGLADLPAPRIAVSLRSHPQLTPPRLQVLTQALKALQQATQTCLLLIPFQPTQDLAIAEAIQAQLTGPNRILQLRDPRQLKGVFQGVELAIAMRLHALIMAAAEGCRCFALSYDPKVNQLMTELNLPGWELSTLPDQPREITQVWLEHYANGAALTPDQIHSLVDRALMHQDLLHQAIAS